jgi:hypothetical protein
MYLPEHSGGRTESPRSGFHLLLLACPRVDYALERRNCVVLLTDEIVGVFTSPFCPRDQLANSANP